MFKHWVELLDGVWGLYISALTMRFEEWWEIHRILQVRCLAAPYHYHWTAEFFFLSCYWFNLNISFKSNRITCTIFFFFSFLFSGHTHGVWKFPGQGSNPCHRSNPSCCRDDIRYLIRWTTRELLKMSPYSLYLLRAIQLFLNTCLLRQVGPCVQDPICRRIWYYAVWCCDL